MFEFYAIDWHSPTHFLGSALLFLSIACTMDYWKAIISAWFLGIVWEVLDEYFAGQWIFDPRGGDWMDIIVDGCGVLLGLLILHFLARRYWSSM